MKSVDSSKSVYEWEEKRLIKNRHKRDELMGHRIDI